MRTGSDRENEQELPHKAAGIPVVGIGASAGGISALESLMPLLEPNAGLAYVVVQHLDPDHESVLTSLLARVARIPVVEIKNHATIRTDHVYVIPRNASLTIADDTLQLSTPVEARGLRMPIDGFFSSLAAGQGEEAGRSIPSR